MYIHKASEEGSAVTGGNGVVSTALVSRDAEQVVFGDLHHFIALRPPLPPRLWDVGETGAERF